MFMNNDIETCNKLQIKKQIRNVRKNIKSTINQIEHLNNDDLTNKNNLLKRLNKLFDELEVYKARLISLGCEYPFSKAELLCQQFEKEIPNIRKMVYVVDEYLANTSSIIFNLESKNLIIESKMNYLFNSAKDRYNILSKEEFYRCLKELKVGYWKREYGFKDLNSNHKWSLKFFYFDQDECLKISGGDIYPYNFDEFKNRLKINI